MRSVESAQLGLVNEVLNEMNDLNLTADSAQYITSTVTGAVATLAMNRPDQLNGWTLDMMAAFKEALSKADRDDRVGAVVFTGTGRYYSAGAHLGGSLKVMHPKKLHSMIVQQNQALFDAFLLFSKPLLVAINGPALGASVTSATLCNGIIASERATFSTPFHALGITPEGCSSILFPRLLGQENAQRMLGEEGWQPNAQEALAAGLVQWVVPHDRLLDEAVRIAQGWVDAGETRQFLAGSTLKELRDANARESEQLADAFLGAPFLRGQSRFLWRKKKYTGACVFMSLWALRPLWHRLT